jgi:tetratricopeptide (TPR) repeat protein
VHVAPIFEEHGDIQLVSTHVNMTIFDEPNTQAGIVLVPARITIDYFRTNNSVVSSEVSENQLQILYWHNLTAEALLAGDIDLAFAYTRRAYELDPLYPETLNFLAVLYNRKGFVEHAYELYDFMLSNKLYSFTAIDNFSQMLKKRGDTARAESISQLVVHIKNDNPFTWIRRGIKSAENGEFRRAEKSFQRSIELAPYLHEPHFQLAKLYAKQQKMGVAKKSLEKAFSLAHTPEHQQRYEAKLYSLKTGAN